MYVMPYKILKLMPNVGTNKGIDAAYGLWLYGNKSSKP